MPSVDEVYKEISDTMKVGKVEKYGPEDLPAGPTLESSREIYVVEGRADIINLMRCGLTNTVALEGAKVPESIKRLTKEKEATALLDGDRGGDLILKELLQVTSIKYVGRAPRGKEIEECNCKEIAEAIDNRIPVAELYKQQQQPQLPIQRKQLQEQRHANHHNQSSSMFSRHHSVPKSASTRPNQRSRQIPARHT